VNSCNQIGKDVLEVESQGVYSWNGVLNAALPSEFSGFAFSHTPTDKHVFEVHLGGRERIKLKTYKDFVSVLIEQGQEKHFVIALASWATLDKETCLLVTVKPSSTMRMPSLRNGRSVTLNPASSRPFVSASGDLHHYSPQADHLRRRRGNVYRRSCC
jgi:hypothetical protein